MWHVGTKENGFDRAILEIESLCQGVYHKEIPVGTVGYRYDKAGWPVATETRICMLYFCFSERKFLEKVEKGTLKINPTKHGIPQFARQYNHAVWDRKTWVPVVLP
jgi:hypothetical protein